VYKTWNSFVDTYTLMFAFQDWWFDPGNNSSQVCWLHGTDHCSSSPHSHG